MSLRRFRNLRPGVGLAFSAAFLLTEPATSGEALDQGRAAIDAGRYLEATEIFDPLCQTLGDAPSDQGRCWFYLGVAWQKRAARSRGDGAPARHDAVAAYRKVLALAQSVAKHEEEPARRVQTKRNPKALGFSIAPALYNLARLEAELGERDSAKKHFRQAIEQTGEARRPAYLESYADCLAEGDEWKEAVALYRLAAVLSPQSIAAHRKLVSQTRERDLPMLKGYLWQLVEVGQMQRARETALELLAEGVGEADLRRNLLSLAAEALSREVYDRRAFAESEAGEGLRALIGDPEIGEGAREILRLHAGASWSSAAYRWWATDEQPESPHNQPERSDAFRQLVLSMGHWYQREENSEVAKQCYGLAQELAPAESDPAATQALADLYLQNGDTDRFHRLIVDYENQLRAETRSSMASKEALLAYREATSRMLAHLGDWGDGSQPGSAFYQLEQSWDLAKQLEQLDRENHVRRFEALDIKPPSDQPALVTGFGGRRGFDSLEMSFLRRLFQPRRSRFDPSLAKLWAEGLELQGQGEQANARRLEIADSYRRNRHVKASDRVLSEIEYASLTPAQLALYPRLKPAPLRIGFLLAEAPDRQYGKEVLNSVAGAFVSSPAFEVVERSRLLSLVGKSNLTTVLATLDESGLSELVGVDLLGVIEYTQGRDEKAATYQIGVKLLDSNTGQILGVLDSWQAVGEPTANPLPVAGQHLQENLRGFFPPEGRVMEVSGRKVVVDLGKHAGINVGDVLEVYRPGETIWHPETGTPVPGEVSLVGTLKITKVGDGTSKGKLKPYGQYQIQADDAVRLRTDKERAAVIKALWGIRATKIQ